MSIMVAVAFLLLIVGIFVGRRVRLSLLRLQKPILSFGEGEGERSWKSLDVVVRKEYLRQQRACFWLCFSAAVAGLVFGIILLSRLVLQEYDVYLFSSIVGMAGDVFFGRGAFRLYKEASSRLHRIKDEG